jgi:protein-disulfide isomerase
MIVASATVIWLTVSRRATAPPRVAVPKEAQLLDRISRLGDKLAPVAIIQYLNFQCRYCGEFARDVLPDLEARYIRTNRVSLTFHHLPLANSSRKSSEMVECGARQGRFREFHDLMFKSAGRPDDAEVERQLADLQVDRSVFKSCLRGDAVEAVKGDVARASRLGVVGTPTFLLGSLQADGTLKVSHVIEGSKPIAEFERAIESILSTMPGGK